MISFAFGFGMVIGSMFGGILIITSNPDANEEDYIPTKSILNIEPFHTTIPFFLPCLIGAIFSFIGILMTILFIHDEKLEDEIKKIRQSFIESQKHNKKEKENNDEQLSEMMLSLGTMEAIAPGQRQIYEFYKPDDAIIKSKDKQPLIKYMDKDNNQIVINNLFKETYIIHGLIQYGGVAIAWMMFKEMEPVFMAQGS